MYKGFYSWRWSGLCRAIQSGRQKTRKAHKSENRRIRILKNAGVQKYERPRIIRPKIFMVEDGRAYAEQCSQADRKPEKHTSQRIEKSEFWKMRGFKNTKGQESAGPQISQMKVVGPVQSNTVRQAENQKSTHVRESKNLNFGKCGGSEKYERPKTTRPKNIAVEGGSPDHNATPLIIIIALAKNAQIKNLPLMEGVPFSEKYPNASSWQWAKRYIPGLCLLLFIRKGKPTMEKAWAPENTPFFMSFPLGPGPCKPLCPHFLTHTCSGSVLFLINQRNPATQKTENRRMRGAKGPMLKTGGSQVGITGPCNTLTERGRGEARGEKAGKGNFVPPKKKIAASGGGIHKNSVSTRSGSPQGEKFFYSYYLKKKNLRARSARKKKKLFFYYHLGFRV